MENNAKLISSVKNNFTKAFNELYWYYENKGFALEGLLEELQAAPVIFDEVPEFYEKLVKKGAITDTQRKQYLGKLVDKLENEILGDEGDSLISISLDHGQIYSVVNKCVDLRKKYGPAPINFWKN